jgi:hypothetical protein
MTPQEFLKIKKQEEKKIKIARLKIDAARELANGCPFPTEIREANEKDIKPDAIIWYKDGDNGPFWVIVDEVLRPSDMWKAYSDTEGCRYGLDGAFVEISD